MVLTSVGVLFFLLYCVINAKWAYHVRVYAILERVLQGIYAVFRQNAQKRTF